MASSSTNAPAASALRSFSLSGVKDLRHKLMLWTLWLAGVGLVVAVYAYGHSYYHLDLEHRADSPLNAALRPSGTIGIRLGILGLALFGVLFLYAIRKRVKWLGRIGSTKRWLDFHVFCGIMAPIVITLHASFKLRGLAGVAYWIMAAVAASGFIGRYLYSQIPRSMSAAELSAKELEAESLKLAETLAQQSILSEDEIAPLMKLPSREDVAAMSLLAVLIKMLGLDILRPFRVSRLRRKGLSASGLALSLGGLLPSGNRELEAAVSVVRSQSWLNAKILYLTRMHEVFHLWHVVHRPFSYSFIVLVLVHITVAMLFGYY